MLKRILLYIVAVALSLYVIVAFVMSHHSDGTAEVRKLRVELKGAAQQSSDIDIDAYLKTRGMDVTSCREDDINLDSLERLVERHPLVSDAECYFSPGRDLVIELWQRQPIVRVFAGNGETYYVGDAGERIAVMDGNVPYVPVLTGDVRYEYVRDTLFDFLSYIHDDAFWQAQVEQVNVAANGEVELVPRVGGITICIGDGNGFESRLENVKLFYNKALATVGWNKYKRINVEFDNQIIAEK
ncbi:MAG TPA: hypothetical protein IAA99_02845 [Candidatus Avibacteroides faecavium]|nr:hypothetical protein [Candidatus Avibacteroides faecavium]